MPLARNAPADLLIQTQAQSSYYHDKMCAFIVDMQDDSGTFLFGDDDENYQEPSLLLVGSSQGQ